MEEEEDDDDDEDPIAAEKSVIPVLESPKGRTFWLLRK
jgi:hypothetical protein